MRSIIPIVVLCFCVQQVFSDKFAKIIHFSKETASWSDASFACRARGMQLYRPLTLAELLNDTLDDSINYNMWLGFSDITTEGHYVDEWGVVISSDFAHSWDQISGNKYQPNNYKGQDNGQDCMMFITKRNYKSVTEQYQPGKWNVLDDASCTSAYRYACREEDYYRSTNKLTWSSASFKCKEMGMQLYVPINRAEIDDVTSNWAYDHWMGFSDIIEEGNFIDDVGLPWSQYIQDLWAGSKTTNEDNEDCVMWRKTDKEQIFGQICSTELRYVCQQAEDPLVISHNYVNPTSLIRHEEAYCIPKDNHPEYLGLITAHDRNALNGSSVITTYNVELVDEKQPELGHKFTVVKAGPRSQTVFKSVMARNLQSPYWATDCSGNYYTLNEDSLLVKQTFHLKGWTSCSRITRNTFSLLLAQSGGDIIHIIRRDDPDASDSVKLTGIDKFGKIEWHNEHLVVGSVEPANELNCYKFLNVDKAKTIGDKIWGPISDVNPIRFTINKEKGWVLTIRAEANSQLNILELSSGILLKTVEMARSFHPLCCFNAEICVGSTIEGKKDSELMAIKMEL